MREALRITVWTFSILVLSSPVLGFAFLKYNGLYDVYGSGNQEISEDSEPEQEECSLFVSFGSFQGNIATSGQQNTCGILLCEGNECGILLNQGSARIEDTDSSQVRARLQALYREKFEHAAELEHEEIVEEAEPPAKSAVEAYIVASNENRYGYALWQWMSVFSTAIVMTQVGFLTSVYTKENGKITGIYHLNFAFVIMYGIICGIIMVSLFASGLLQGSLFPEFSGDELNYGFNSISALKIRGPDWFKLAIWCYIAGFYERFLPSIFSDLLRSSKGNAEGGPASRSTEDNSEEAPASS